MTGPRVSVVLATYSRQDYLREAVQSVLAQTYTAFELIVGNDGGPAHTAPLREHFTDERVVWIEHHTRKGLLGNTLDGLARARGAFVAIIQDDDRWSPELLATLVPPLEADPSLTLAFGDHFIIDADGRIDEELTRRNSARWGRDALAPGVHRPFRRLAVQGAVPIQCAAVFRRDALAVSQFPADAGTKFDRWLCRELARGESAAYYVPRRLACYRSHSGQQTATGQLENARAGIYIFERFLADPELADVPRGQLIAALAADHYQAGVALIRAGRSRPARRHLVRAARLAGHRRAPLALAASFLPRSIATRL